MKSGIDGYSRGKSFSRYIDKQSDKPSEIAMNTQKGEDEKFFDMNSASEAREMNVILENNKEDEVKFDL